MSGGKSQAVVPRMVIAGDISLPLSHIGCGWGDFMEALENSMPRRGLVPYRKRLWLCCATGTRLMLGLVIAVLRSFLKAVHSEDRGQDLAEYCLLTALVALVAVGILIQVSGGMQAVWNSANTTLAGGRAASPATSSPASAPASSLANAPASAPGN